MARSSIRLLPTAGGRRAAIARPIRLRTALDAIAIQTVDGKGAPKRTGRATALLLLADQGNFVLVDILVIDAGAIPAGNLPAVDGAACRGAWDPNPALSTDALYSHLTDRQAVVADVVGAAGSG